MTVKATRTDIFVPPINVALDTCNVEVLPLQFEVDLLMMFNREG